MDSQRLLKTPNQNKVNLKEITYTGPNAIVFRPWWVPSEPYDTHIKAMFLLSKKIVLKLIEKVTVSLKKLLVFVYKPKLTLPDLVHANTLNLPGPIIMNK